jgi:hypothetical protein
MPHLVIIGVSDAGILRAREPLRDNRQGMAPLVTGELNLQLDIQHIRRVSLIDGS